MTNNRDNIYRPINLIIMLALIFMFASCSGKKDIRPEGAFNPEKTFNKANELIDKKEYEDARKLLLEVKNRDATKKYAPLAQLKIAESYTREQEYDLSVEEYRNFLAMYPDHSYASYAQYQIAMNYFVQIESPDRGFGAASRALSEFEKLKVMFPRNPYKEVIELRIEKCRDTIADYEFLVAAFYYKKGSYSSALGRLQTLLTKSPDFKKEPEALYLLGLSHKKLGNKEMAIEYFKRTLEKYPNDKITKDAAKELSSLTK